MKSFFQKQNNFSWNGACLAFGLLLFVLKLLIIAHYGSATPYWDQWDAEAANLYKPCLEGTWTFGQFFTAHNEHRILTTRLLALLLIEINGLWNPLLQMVINALLHTSALLVACLLLLRAVGEKMLLPLLLFAAIFFSFPYGWENILSGFQAQFYFVLLFSAVALFLLIEKRAWSPLWWLGFFSGVLAFFSLASGIFALAAVAAVFGIQYVLQVDRSWKKIIATLALIVLVALGLLFTPTIAGHAALKAHSIMQFGAAFITTMSWPLPGNFFWFIFRNAPSMILCLHLFLSKPPINDRRWFLLGFVIWTAAQAASIAYGRVDGCLSSRYLDLFSLSVLINFACLLDQYPFKNALQRSIVAFWSVIVVISLAWYCHKNLPQQLAEKFRTGNAQTLNVQNYQRSGDINDLKNKPFQEIPYPDPNRLAEVLSSPTIQKILPANIQKSFHDSSTQGCLDGIIHFLLSHELVIVLIGLLLGCLACCL